MSYKNVSDIPKYDLFQFDEYYYVWKIELHSTRKGKYPAKEVMDITEVYEIYNNMVICVASGRLIENKNSNTNNKISIFDYDQNTIYTFDITKPLKKASTDTLLLLRESISEEYNRNNMNSSYSM